MGSSRCGFHYECAIFKHISEEINSSQAWSIMLDHELGFVDTRDTTRDTTRRKMYRRICCYLFYYAATSQQVIRQHHVGT